jgi:cyclophilin family peptidyl-prolyl cis-trans isomerase
MRTVRRALLVACVVAATALTARQSSADDPSIAVDTRITQADVVLVKTNLGDFKIKLEPTKAPKTVANFMKYVDERHYDSLTFHRVIPGFMIQGGGHNAKMVEKPTRPPIANESGNGLSNVRGSIAMARTVNLDSATAQFYINVVDNLNLDKAKYCVFGQVIEGMDVVDKIQKVPTGNNGVYRDVPVQPVVIQSIRRAGS